METAPHTAAVRIDAARCGWMLHVTPVTLIPVTVGRKLLRLSPVRVTLDGLTRTVIASRREAESPRLAAVTPSATLVP